MSDVAITEWRHHDCDYDDQECDNTDLYMVGLDQSMKGTTQMLVDHAMIESGLDYGPVSGKEQSFASPRSQNTS